MYMESKACSKCFEMREINQFISKNGARVTKSCQTCRNKIINSNNKYKCIHRRFKYQCTQCNGSSMCSHGNQKYECLICNPEYYLKRRTLNRIQQALHLPTTDGINAEHFLGCTLSHFKTHLELSFKTGMSWENYGNLWQIDHKIPLKYNKPTTDEIINRFHYTNTQALYTSENTAKGNRYIS